MTFTVIDSATGETSILEIEPVKVTLANSLEVYGLTPVGQSLVERQKRTYEVGEDVGIL